MVASLEHQWKPEYFVKVIVGVGTRQELRYTPVVKMIQVYN